jgi:hypothetical protein
MKNKIFLTKEWDHVLSFMPKDLEESCKLKLALRRCREVASASDLLRICLAYSLCDMSLRQVAAWAEVIGLGHFSNVAVLKRLRAASDWIGHVLAKWLIERGLTKDVPKSRVRVIDATIISKPGSKGTDWCLHVDFDLRNERIVNVELTDSSEGESLKRHSYSKGDIILADRAYSKLSGMTHVLRAGAHVILRGRCNGMPLYTKVGTPIQLLPLLESLGSNEVADWDVFLHENGHKYPMRLVAIRKSEASTEKERKKITHEATRKRRQPSDISLRAAEFIFVITDLSREEASAVQVLEFYRLRWQIEIAFKRLKSVLQIDELRAKEPRLARTYILSKILGALIVEEMTGIALDFFPWGFRLTRKAFEPLAHVQDLGRSFENSY